MILKTCDKCKGEYLEKQKDGLLYFHTCPIKTDEQGEAIVEEIIENDIIEENTENIFDKIKNFFTS